MDMSGLPGVADAFGLLMLASALQSVIRLALARRIDRVVDVHVDLHHILMGISMAGMLVPALGLFSAGPVTTAWTVVWVAATAWFAVDVVRRVARGHLLSRHLSGHARHHLPHLAMSAAMVYMLTAPLAHPIPGAPAIALPSLDLAFLALMVAYAVGAVDRASADVGAGRLAPGLGEGTAARPLLAPRLAALQNAAMGLTMAYMLVLMLA